MSRLRWSVAKLNFLTPGGEKLKRLPLTDIANFFLKKIIFLKFPLFCLNLKFVERTKSAFYLKYSFSHPSEFAARDGRTTRTTLATPLTMAVSTLVKFTLHKVLCGRLDYRVVNSV
jgi:hypothetical protein